MMITCLECGQHFKGKFCPNCGQSAAIKRLSAAVLLEEILHFFTHLESGFIFTSWNFLVRPGISSMEYISGKRKKYQKPVSFLLIWAGLYILQHNADIKYFHYSLSREVISGLSIQEQSNLLFREHFTIFLIPVLFVSAILLYFIMARPIFNFTELLILCFYGMGVYFMLSLGSDVVLGVIFRKNILEMEVFMWQALMSSIYNLWFSYDVFKRLKLRFFWLRLFSVAVLVMISGWLIMFYLPMLWIYLS